MQKHSHARRANTNTCLAGDAAQFRLAGEPFFHTKTIFDKFVDIGVCVAQEKRFYQYRITYDIKKYTDAEGGPRRYTTMFL